MLLFERVQTNIIYSFNVDIDKFLEEIVFIVKIKN